MATDGYADRWNGVAYAAADERRMASIDQMPGSAAAPFSARGGRRVNGSGLNVTVSSTGNGSVTVTAGACRVYDANFASQGGWDAEFPNTVGPLTLSARPASGQSRIDLVVARIYDADLSVGSVKEAKIEVVTGGPGASPSAPGTPAMSLVLATLTVPSSGTISVTQAGAKTVSAGGVLPVETTSERDDLVTAEVAYPGLVVFNAQTQQTEAYTGSGWTGAAWAAWSFSGSGFGTGITFSGAYRQSGKTVTARFRLTTSVNGLTGSATLALPVTPHAVYGEAETAVGSCLLRDASAGSPSRTGGTVVISGGSVFFVADRVAPGTVTSSVPWAWAAGDTIAGTVTYEAA